MYVIISNRFFSCSDGVVKCLVSFKITDLHLSQLDPLGIYPTKYLLEVNSAVTTFCSAARKYIFKGKK